MIPDAPPVALPAYLGPILVDLMPGLLLVLAGLALALRAFAGRPAPWRRNER